MNRLQYEGKNFPESRRVSSDFTSNCSCEPWMPITRGGREPARVQAATQKARLTRARGTCCRFLWAQQQDSPSTESCSSMVDGAGVEGWKWVGEGPRPCFRSVRPRACQRLGQPRSLPLLEEHSPPSEMPVPPSGRTLQSQSRVSSA